MFDHCIYFNLVTLNRKIGRVWQSEFEKLGLSTSQAYLLFALVQESELTQKDLGQLLELNASTVTRFVDDLVRKGLLEKVGKGKGSLIQVTSLGKKECRKIKKTMDLLFSKTQNQVGKSNFSSFVDGLHKMKQSLF